MRNGVWPHDRVMIATQLHVEHCRHQAVPRYGPTSSPSTFISSRCGLRQQEPHPIYTVKHTGLASQAPSYVNSRNGRRATCRQIATAALPAGVQEVLAAATTSSPGLQAGLLVNTTIFVLGIQVLLKGLTWEGVANSWLLGSTVYSAFGPGAYLLVCLYFVLGTAVTKLKLAQKEKEGIAEKRSGRRGAASVWGSGIAGTACAVAALATGQPELWRIGFVASFCSKLSDTVSSEVGKAYGTTTFLATTFQRVPRGTEGAVSLEGTSAGLAAAAVFSTIALATGQVENSQGALVVALVATVANYAESLLGASAQGKVEWLTNDVVNMLQISLAAVLAIAAQNALS